MLFSQSKVWHALAPDARTLPPASASDSVVPIISPLSQSFPFVENRLVTPRMLVVTPKKHIFPDVGLHTSWMGAYFGGIIGRSKRYAKHWARGIPSE